MEILATTMLTPFKSLDVPAARGRYTSRLSNYGRVTVGQPTERRGGNNFVDYAGAIVCGSLLLLRYTSQFLSISGQ